MSKTFQLHISLNLKPLDNAERVLMLQDDISLYELHVIIQLAMGWKNAHSHEFKFHDVPEPVYGNLIDMEETSLPSVVDSRIPKLWHMVEKGESFTYVYDMGDNWEHNITVEEIYDEPFARKAPLCIAGKGNCPPEDCGGRPGYMRLLEVTKDKLHPEYKELMRWLRIKYFEPNDFNIDTVNGRLSSWRLRVKSWEAGTFGS